MRSLRLLLITSFVAALFALAPTAATAATCWKELVNDYWADNRVDRTYPIACYREAMEKLPRDVQEYSDAQDDLRRALLAAIRDERDSGGGFTGGGKTGAPSFEDDPTVSPGVASSDDDEASPGFVTEVLEKLGPKNADSIPVPLLVLGSIALLLIGAAGVSQLAKYVQARRGDPLA
jgi:hypothetical protein